jgi:hypothetical protein
MISHITGTDLVYNIVEELLTGSIRWGFYYGPSGLRWSCRIKDERCCESVACQ